MNLMYRDARKFKKILSMVWGMLPQRRDQQSIPVLCYHSVNEVWDDDVEPMSPRLFEKHLDFLKQSYQPISLTVWMDSILHRKPVPKNAVLITFDDGYLDNYETVFPKILVRRIPICIFVVTEFVKGNIGLVDNQEFSAINVEQMLKMKGSGLVSFGAHTRSHRALSSLADCEIHSEVFDSIDTLDRILGSPTQAFAYPYGQFCHVGSAGINAVERSSAVVAFSTQWGSSSPDSEPFFIPRIMINSSDSVEDLSDKLKGKYGYLKLLHGWKTGVWKKFETLGI